MLRQRLAKFVKLNFFSPLAEESSQGGAACRGFVGPSVKIEEVCVTFIVLVPLVLMFVFQRSFLLVMPRI